MGHIEFFRGPAAIFDRTRGSYGPNRSLLNHFLGNRKFRVAGRTTNLFSGRAFRNSDRLFAMWAARHLRHGSSRLTEMGTRLLRGRVPSSFRIRWLSFPKHQDATAYSNQVT